MPSESIAVLGAGSWGATLAQLLSSKGHKVVLWEFLPEAARRLRETRRLSILPQLDLDPSIEVTDDLARAAKAARSIVSAVPSQCVRSTFSALREEAPIHKDTRFVSVTKGIENATFMRMSQIIAEELPAAQGHIAVLSGPSHAEEVAQKVPTAVVTAGPGKLADEVQNLFNTKTFRVYSSPDFVGVELGGALKNIYAIASGASDGLGLGDNAKAALLTRAVNEMVQVGVGQGADGLTFFGLSGMGDLIVTCFSRHSRNRLYGEKIGQGKSPEAAKREMTMVAEGVPTTESVYHLAKKNGLDLPIVGEIYACLYQNKSARESLHDLMHRPVKSEMVHLNPFFPPESGSPASGRSQRMAPKSAAKRRIQ